jgi:hypothetical protein
MTILICSTTASRLHNANWIYVYEHAYVYKYVFIRMFLLTYTHYLLQVLLLFLIRSLYSTIYDKFLTNIK